MPEHIFAGNPVGTRLPGVSLGLKHGSKTDTALRILPVLST